MRPSFNSFQPRSQRQQQQNNGYSNHHQHNGYQNPKQFNQVGMMNPQTMSNPMMNYSIPMPNMPIYPHFSNNLSNMPQQQQHPFAMPTISTSYFLAWGIFSLQQQIITLWGHSLPLVQPNFCRPSLEPSAFTSQPQLNSFNPIRYPPVPTSHQNHQLKPPGFSEPRPQGQCIGNVDNTNGFGNRGNDFRNKYTKHQKFKCPGQGSQLHQTNNRKRKSGFNKDHVGKGNYNKMASGLNESHTGNITKENKRGDHLLWSIIQKKFSNGVQLGVRTFQRNSISKSLRKLKKNASDCVLDEEAILRRQQHREVLAKQAELGVEVAEVSSHYLSTTEEQVNVDREDNNGRFQYKDGKKGRFQNSRHNRKRQRVEKDNSRKKNKVPIQKLISRTFHNDEKTYIA